jgi:hypothetical protein
MLTFILSGLWHGAGWTYIIWAFLHGALMVIGRLTENLRGKIIALTKLDRLPRIHRALRISITFLTILFTWIFFRANSINDAFYIIAHMFDNAATLLVALFTGNSELVKSLTDIADGNLLLGFPKATYRAELTIAFISIGILILINKLKKDRSLIEMLQEKSALFRWLFLYGMVAGIFLFGVFTRKYFIYFRF